VFLSQIIVDAGICPHCALTVVSVPGPTELGADSCKQLPDIRITAGQAGRYTLLASVIDREGKLVSESNCEFRIK
jgi:hypothetical protein